MKFNLQATKRDAKGSGASRRLRHTGNTPAIIYGNDQPVAQISLDHNTLFYALQKEAFHSSIIAIDVEGTKEVVILRDVQWHPVRQLVQHVDFQRIDTTHPVHIKLPVHFINADACPGVKVHKGIVSHSVTELDIKGLAAELPSFIEIDLKDLDTGAALHLKDVKLPKGVELAHTTDGEKVVASVVTVRGNAADEAEAAPAAAAPAAGEGEAKA